MLYHGYFGEHFASIDHNYRRGQMQLAYKIVINSNPCIASSLWQQTLQFALPNFKDESFGLQFSRRRSFAV